MAGIESRQTVIDLYGQHRYVDAAEAAHTWLERNPADLPILEILADSAIQAGHLDAGLRVARHLVSLERTPGRLASLATVLSAHGDLAGAIALLKEGLSRDPAHPRCWGLVAGMYRFGKSDPLIAKAKRMLKQKHLQKVSRRAILYALSKAMNDLGKWDRAWDYAAEGAALAKPDYDPDAFDHWVDDLEDTFDAEFLKARPTRGVQSAAPVFIVGMPRSGTTLMEIILAATGQVTPMGELTTIPDITEQAVRDDVSRGNSGGAHGWVQRWRDAAFTEVGEFYLTDVAKRAGGTVPRIFTDKLPGNLLYLGQIGLIFPNARIIWMQRDPLDTCVSCYLGQFNDGHHYTYRTDWLARAARGFQRAGDVLTPMLPNPVLKVCYEDLVSRPEAQIRRVLEFVGVEWTPNCLAPQPTGYATTTRSVEQVRKPINASSVGRWRRYANRIEPLARALQIETSEAV